MTVSIKLSSSTRFATRDVLMANLGLVFNSGCEMPSQIRPKRRSFPPPKRISPSFVLYDLYGTMEAVCRQLQSINEEKGRLNSR